MKKFAILGLAAALLGQAPIALADECTKSGIAFKVTSEVSTGGKFAPAVKSDALVGGQAAAQSLIAEQAKSKAAPGAVGARDGGDAPAQGLSLTDGIVSGSVLSPEQAHRGWDIYDNEGARYHFGEVPASDTTFQAAERAAAYLQAHIGTRIALLETELSAWRRGSDPIYRQAEVFVRRAISDPFALDFPGITFAVRHCLAWHYHRLANGNALERALSATYLQIKPQIDTLLGGGNVAALRVSFDQLIDGNAMSGSHPENLLYSGAFRSCLR